MISLFFRDACDRTATSRDGWLSFVTPSLNGKIQSEIKVDSRNKMNLSWSLVMNGSHSGQFPLIWNSLKLVSDELTLTLVWAIHHVYPLQIHYLLTKKKTKCVVVQNFLVFIRTGFNQLNRGNNNASTIVDATIVLSTIIAMTTIPSNIVIKITPLQHLSNRLYTIAG